jgi:hypothetical protein
MPGIIRIPGVPRDAPAAPITISLQNNRPIYQG